MTVTNEEELKAWLGEQPRQMRALVATRAVMRCLPFAVVLDRFDGAEGKALATLRTLITSGVMVEKPSLPISPYARAELMRNTFFHERSRGPKLLTEAVLASAIFAARVNVVGANGMMSEVLKTIEAANQAALVEASIDVVAAYNTAMSLQSAIYSDTAKNYRDLSNSPIGVPNTLARTIERYVGEGASALNGFAPWAFWAEWYARAMAGDPLDWKLQEQIALIPDDVWEAGPDAVAEAIEKLRFKFRTNVAPNLVRDEEAGLFRVETDTEPLDDVAGFAANRATQSLKAALESVSPNVFNSGSYEAVVISGALDGPRTTSLLATGLYEACLGFHANIGDRYPEEIALINLKNALAGIVDELCEADEVARKRCANMAGYVAPSDENVLSEEELLAIPDLTAPEMDGQAKEIIESDVERALAELSRQEAMPRWRRIRLANWMTTISIYWDRTKKGFKEAETLAKMVSKLRAAWRNWGDGAE